MGRLTVTHNFGWPLSQDANSDRPVPELEVDGLCDGARLHKSAYVLRVTGGRGLHPAGQQQLHPRRSRTSDEDYSPAATRPASLTDDLAIAQLLGPLSAWSQEMPPASLKRVGQVLPLQLEAGKHH